VWLRSRSLWDYRLPLPDDKPALGVVRRLDVPGPDRSTVVVLEQALVYDTPMGLQTRRITAAMDRAEIDRAVAAYSADLWTALTALGLILSLAAAVQVWFGLRPLESVRRGIGAIRRQSQRRLTGPFPDEIMPLVVEVNGLLDAQDELVAKARNRAADLAHGLKTPLTVIANDARKLRGRGEEEIAEELEALVRSMRRHVDHELARARVAADTARREASTDLVTVTSGIIATLRRTPQGGGLEWIARMPETMPVALDENDLSEVVGNLLENASKWAERGIEVDLSRVGSVVRLSVADDGSGVSDALIDALGQRGLRLDRQTPGTGMGLAIVREIVAAYDGELSYENRVEGGFRVTVDLPTAESM
jgi:signal transduction histidine kinase